MWIISLILCKFGENMEVKRYPLCKIQPVMRITAFCSAYVDVRPVGYSYDGEMHDFWESVFVLKGKAGITAGESVYRLGEGQMIFHPPMEFHRIWNDGDEPLHFLIVSFTASGFHLDSHRICTFPSSDTIAELVRELRKLFVTKEILLLRMVDESCAAAVQSVVNRLENYFLGLLSREEAYPVVEQDKRADLYSAAVSIMHRNLFGRLSATQIAEHCGMSVSTMQKLFLRYTGMGMMNYYTSLRMRHARQLLESGRSVKEVGMLLGYGDQNYFSTVYRRYFGEPPSAAKGKGIVITSHRGDGKQNHGE